MWSWSEELISAILQAVVQEQLTLLDHSTAICLPFLPKIRRILHHSPRELPSLPAEVTQLAAECIQCLVGLQETSMLPTDTNWLTANCPLVDCLFSLGFLGTQPATSSTAAVASFALQSVQELCADSHNMSAVDLYGFLRILLQELVVSGEVKHCGKLEALDQTYCNTKFVTFV